MYKTGVQNLDGLKASPGYYKKKHLRLRQFPADIPHFFFSSYYVARMADDRCTVPGHYEVKKLFLPAWGQFPASVLRMFRLLCSSGSTSENFREFSYTACTQIQRIILHVPAGGENPL
jgi:hypothetical protein